MNHIKNLRPFHLAFPVRHFGVILENNEWQKLVDRLKTKGEDFLIEPRVRFEGKSGEQRTLFILDPSGNALEFKSFAHDGHIFRR